MTHLRSRKDEATVEPDDAALGQGLQFPRPLAVRRLAAGEGRRQRTELCLIDIKEAVHAAAPRAPDAPDRMLPENSAEQMVMGARALALALGDRMIATQFLGKPRLRELLPQDLKVEIDRLTGSQACKAARYLDNVVGLAHGRKMRTADRLAWKKLLRQ